jgi:hypothetical protein
MSDALLAARDQTADRLAGICDLIIERNHERNGVRDHLAEEKAVFEGGATRSAKLERYDLIPPEAEQCEAKRFGIGAIAHGENNWKNGGAEFIAQVINHMRAHLNSLQINGPLHTDDDIGAIRWGTAALAWFRAHKPDEFLKALGMSRRPVEHINPLQHG